MIKYLLVLFVSLCLVVPVVAQEEKPDSTEAETVDTIDTGDEWDEWDKWENEDDKDWNRDFNMNVFDFSGAPTMVLNYGLSQLAGKNFQRSFADPNSIELKLGYTDLDEVWQNKNILKTKFKNLFVTNITTDLVKLDNSTLGYRTNTWKFGAGKSEGYGYKLGPSALYFTNGSSLDWTRLRIFDAPSGRDIDRNESDLFNNTFRFGTSAEAGIRLQIIRQISIEADYERSAVFPRHLFWKWLGSAVIENAGQFLLDEFVDEIVDSSPYFAPVISFLLKNGLSYGIYELRKEKMNWPFKSAAPVTFDQFKFGLTFVL